MPMDSKTSPQDRQRHASGSSRASSSKWIPGGPATSGEWSHSLSSGATHAPLSYSQLRLWFLQQIVPESPSYNIPLALRLRGSIDMRTLEESLRAVVSRHRVLSARITIEQSEPIQHSSDVTELGIKTIDLTGQEPSAREKLAAELLEAESRMPFDLSAGPLLRATIARLAPDDHLLLITLHHIAADGWSVGIFYSEMIVLYQAFLNGEPSPLPPLPYQYFDFATWHRQSISGERLSQLVEEWKQELEGAPPVLEFPADWSRPVVQTFKGDTVQFPIANDLLERLTILANSERASLYMVLYAAFSAFLFRMTGQRDLCIGSPVANRDRLELERLIGPFANTLVLRSRIGAQTSFRQFLRKCREHILDAHSHAEVPFERLVEVLGVERDTSRNPLVQVLFNFQSSSTPAKKIEGLTIEAIQVSTATSKFDLSLSVMKAPEACIGTFEYSSDLFDVRTIDRFVGRFVTLLGSIAANPDSTVEELEQIPDDEKECVLRRWNDTERRWDAPATLHGMVSRQANTSPDRTAAIAESQSLSYWDLETISNRLAHRLASSGAHVESRIGVCMYRSLDMMVALLAVLKAGCAFVPLNLDDPPSRLQYMLNDAGVSHLIVGPNFDAVRICGDDREKWPAIVAIDGLCGLEGWSESELDLNVDGNNLAYVLYTSGSTGQPKGAMNTHAGIRNRLLWMQEAYGLTEDDRVLQKTPSTFDVSVWEFFWPLCVGATLVFAKPGGHTDPDYLVELIRAERISTIHFVPCMLPMFLDQPATMLCESLRRVIVSGEALTGSLVRKFKRVLSCPLHNLYGPTEAAIDVTAHACADNESDNVPIGRPVANTQIYVLDSSMIPTPIGVTGDLYIAGVQVARGYFGRPALTAASFVPCPFENGGRRMYRTGDLARWTPSGELQFLGRADDQVKIHGVRLELSEVESALRRQPQVADVAVAVREDTPGTHKLAAYIVANKVRNTEESDAFNRELEHYSLAQWTQTFDLAYSGSECEDQRFDTSGWVSSQSRQPFTHDEMEEWVRNTTDQILQLNPQRVLEIGCGTGLLLFRIAPHCCEYRATDAVPGVVERLTAVAAQDPLLKHVTLSAQLAHDFSDIAANHYDLVILNSVVQYFPTAAYLKHVIANAVQTLVPSGTIFVGDVRNLSLLETFCASLVLDRSGAEIAIRDIHQGITSRIAREHELILDPRFFHSLPSSIPEIRQVHVRIKRGRARNEMTRFRYDVLLQVAPPPQDGDQLQWHDWTGEVLDLDSVRQILVTRKPRVFAISNVPDARVRPEFDLSQRVRLAAPDSTLADVMSQSAGEPVSGLAAPEDFFALGHDAAFSVELRPSDPGVQPAAFDAIFSLPGVHVRETVQPTPESASFANSPQDEVARNRMQRDLREGLQASLPESMIPSSFVFLDSIPRTANGKVDRRALPAPESLRSARDVYAAPSTETEKLMAGIWKDVLRVESVSLDENFFELGGDSIQVIQIVSRLHEAGLQIAPRDMFSHQTVREIVELINGRSQLNGTEATGWQISVSAFQALVMTESSRRPACAIHCLAVPIGSEIDVSVTKQAFEAVLQRHEAFRLCGAENEGVPSLSVHPSPARVPLAVIDVCDGSTPEDAIAKNLSILCSQINLESTHTAACAVLRSESWDGHRLLLISHAAVADAASLSVVAAELSHAVECLKRGQQIHFPHPAPQMSEISAMLNGPRMAGGCKTIVSPTLTPIFEAHATKTEIVPLPDTLSARIVGGELRISVHEIALTAIARAARARGARSLDVQMAAVELAAPTCVGAFETRLRISLEFWQPDSIWQLKYLKDALRSALRDSERERGLTLPATGVRILARVAPPIRAAGEFAELANGLQLRDPAIVPAACPPDYDCCVDVAIGSQRCAMVGGCSTLGQEETSQIVVDSAGNLKELIGDCERRKKPLYTVGDFPETELDETHLEALCTEPVDEILPLTPLQAHMLAERLRNPTPGLYLTHLLFKLGSVNIDALSSACNYTLGAFGALRGAFYSKGLRKPVQVLRPASNQEIEYFDLRSDSGNFDERVEDYIRQIRARGFALSQFPQSHRALFRIADDSYRFLWFFNYMLQDGWSFPIFFQYFLSAYDALAAGRGIPPAPSDSFPEFVRWTQSAPSSDVQYFRDLLDGYDFKSSLLTGGATATTYSRGGYRKIGMNLSVAETSALRAFAQRHHLTVFTLVAAAWALVLSRVLHRNEVLFGVWMSGRRHAPPEIKNVVGLCNSAAPARVNTDKDLSMIRWLAALQSGLNQLQEREHTPLASISEAIGRDPAQLLFESYLVFENFPIDSRVGEAAGTLGFIPIDSLAQTEHPLRVELFPGNPMTIRMCH